MAQHNLVDIEQEIAAPDDEAQHLLTFGQLLDEPSVLNVVGAPVAGLEY